MKCKNCKKYNRFQHWCEDVLDSPNEEEERECMFYMHMTYADRIRSSTDEELAEIFCNMQMCKFCIGEDGCNSEDGKANGMLKILKMGVQDDEG